MRYDSIGRRIPKRTKEWRENISKALDKKYEETCQFCLKKFMCHRYRKGIVKFCSRGCSVSANKGREKKKLQKPKVKYSGIHMWARRHLPAIQCELCGKNTKLHRANISGKYKRDLSDWKVLCVPCHSEFDGNNKIPNSSNDKLVSMREQGLSFQKIAKWFGVTRKAVSKRYYRITK